MQAMSGGEPVHHIAHATDESLTQCGQPMPPEQLQVRPRRKPKICDACSVQFKAHRWPSDEWEATVGVVATRDPKTRAIPLDELVERLQALREMTGADRVLEARRLSDVTAATLQAVGDEGVASMTRPRGRLTYVEAARELGYTDDGSIGRAVSRHNRRQRGEL